MIMPTHLDEWLPLPDDFEAAVATEVMGWHERSYVEGGSHYVDYLIPGAGPRPRPSWQPSGDMQDLEAVIAAVLHITGEMLEIEVSNGWVATFGVVSYGSDSIGEAVCKAAILRVRLHRNGQVTK